MVGFIGGYHSVTTEVIKDFQNRLRTELDHRNSLKNRFRVRLCFVGALNNNCGRRPMGPCQVPAADLTAAWYRLLTKCSYSEKPTSSDRCLK